MEGFPAYGLRALVVFYHLGADRLRNFSIYCKLLHFIVLDSRLPKYSLFRKSHSNIV